jgi:hypothetical protein
MALHGDLSPEARLRAERTVAVAAVISDHAEVIVAQLPDVPAGHVLVAVVDPEQDFAGMHHVHQESLVERVPELESGGWSMVFSPGATVADVQRRTTEMASLARQRMAAIDRINARRAAG